MVMTMTTLRPLVQLHQQTAELVKMVAESSLAQSGMVVGRTMPQAEKLAFDLSIITGFRWTPESAHGNTRGWMSGRPDLVAYDARIRPEVADQIRRWRRRDAGLFEFATPLAIDVA